MKFLLLLSLTTFLSLVSNASTVINCVETAQHLNPDSPSYAWTYTINLIDNGKATIDLEGSQILSAPTVEANVEQLNENTIVLTKSVNFVYGNSINLVRLEKKNNKYEMFFLGLGSMSDKKSISCE